MNLHVTPSQRQFSDAHQQRLHLFWPSTIPAVRRLKQISNDQFKEAWKFLDCRPSIREIQEASCRHFGVPQRYMEYAGRSTKAFIPRAIAIYLSRILTLHSYPAIGKHFGGRDHTTVMHSFQRVEKLIAEDQSIARDVEALTCELGGQV